MSDTPEVAAAKAVLKARIDGYVTGKPRSPTDVMRVLEEPILLPDSRAITFRPHWEPHDETTDSDNRTASYFWFFDDLYDTNPLWAAVVQAYRDLIMYQGFRFVSKNPVWEDRWNRWWQEANAERQLGVAILEAVKSGNGPLVLVRETNDILDLKLQDLPARGFFPVADDEGRWSHLVFIWPDTEVSTDGVMHRFASKKGQRVEFEDVFFLKINRIAGAFFGRPPTYQAMNLANELLELLMIFSSMARRTTHGLLHAMVDLTDLDDQPREDPDTGEPIMSEQEERIWQVQKMLDGRTDYNRQTKRTKIAANLVTGKDVELKVLEVKNDMEGVEKAVNQIIRVLDRAWRLPRILQGEGESSNRANSVVQMKQSASVFEEWWANVAEELHDKIVPALGIPKEAGRFEPTNELVVDDELVRAKVMETISKLRTEGILDDVESRTELDPLLRYVDLDLEDREPVEIDEDDTLTESQQEAKEADDAEAEQDST